MRVTIDIDGAFCGCRQAMLSPVLDLCQGRVGVKCACGAEVTAPWASDALWKVSIGGKSIPFKDEAPCPQTAPEKE